MAFFDTTPSACFIDDLLNFNIDKTDALITNAESFLPSSAPVFTSPECEDDEELEWLSNEDVFPSVDTFVPCVEPFVDMMSLDSNTSTTTLKHESPDSVLENSNPVITTCFTGRRPRTTRRRVQGSLLNISSQQWFIKASETSEGITGRKCKHCGSEKTPQWRAGPEGPKTLCNACGVRYKSGRLCAEYRPANSPTFLSAVHSSSHRMIIEMRKLKQQRTIANGSGNFNGA